MKIEIYYYCYFFGVLQVQDSSGSEEIIEVINLRDILEGNVCILDEILSLYSCSSGVILEEEGGSEHSQEEENEEEDEKEEDNEEEDDK